MFPFCNSGSQQGPVLFGSSTNIFQDIIFCSTKKVKQVWKDMRVNK